MQWHKKITKKKKKKEKIENKTWLAFIKWYRIVKIFHIESHEKIIYIETESFMNRKHQWEVFL